MKLLEGNSARPNQEDGLRTRLTLISSLVALGLSLAVTPCRAASGDPGTKEQGGNLTQEQCRAGLTKCVDKPVREGNQAGKDACEAAFRKCFNELCAK